jgi:uncharacterized phage-associated protein
MTSMLINREREKLINVIIFFARNSRYFGKTKLCKLLYFLDFEHFRETGRSVTGLDYYAWKNGPVPVELYQEVDMPEPDLAERVRFTEKPTRRGPMLTVEPVSEFDASLFSKRECRLMESLANEYRDTLAEDMIETTHLENQPWHQIYVVENKKQQLIPYELALRKQEADAMKGLITSRKAVVEHFGEK